MNHLQLTSASPLTSPIALLLLRRRRRCPPLLGYSAPPPTTSLISAASSMFQAFIARRARARAPVEPSASMAVWSAPIALSTRSITTSPSPMAQPHRSAFSPATCPPIPATALATAPTARLRSTHPRCVSSRRQSQHLRRHCLRHPSRASLARLLLTQAAHSLLWLDCTAATPLALRLPASASVVMEVSSVR